MMKRFNFNSATKAMLGAGLLSLLLTACGGSDGKDGEDGKPGPVGLDVGQATTLKASLEDVKIDNGIVSVNIVLTNANGVPVTGLEQYAQVNSLGLGIAKLSPQSGKGYKTPQWTSYINTVQAVNPARSLTNYTYTVGGVAKDVKFTPGDAIQANIESSCKTACLTVVDAGVYRYTFKANLSTLNPIDGLDLTYDPALVHRITLELQTDGSKDAKLVNSHIDFLPSDNFKEAAATDTRTVVDLEANCIKCHNTNYSDTSSTAKPLALHGGKRIAIANCQVCHNSYSKDPETGASLDMGAMVHAIHKGTYTMVGYGGTIYDFSGTIPKAEYPLFREGKDVSERVTLPVSIGTCESCHSIDGKGPVDADNFKHHRGLACASCHMTGFNTVDNSEWLTPPEGQKDRGFVGNYFHYYATPEIDGIPGADLVNVFQNGGCAACHAAEGEEGSAKYHLAKTVVTKNIRDEYAYKLGNGTFDASGNKLTFTVQWHNDTAPNADTSVKALWLVAATLDKEYQIGYKASTFGSHPGRFSVNLVKEYPAITMAQTGNTLTYTIAGITQPDMIALKKGTLSAKLFVCADQSETKAVDCSDTTITHKTEVIIAANQASFAGISAGDSPFVARNVVASEAKCANCHGKQADFSVAHSRVRATGSPDSGCSSCHTSEPNTAVALTDGSCVTCHNNSLTAANSTGHSATRAKDFSRGFDFKVMVHQIHANTRSGRFGNYTTDVTFPENPANCAVCHDKGQLNLTTLGDKPVFIASTGEYSPTVAACASCHAPTAEDNSAVISHFETNGGVYNGTAGAYISGGETCATCHGEGKSSGVDKVHPVKY